MASTLAQWPQEEASWELREALAGTTEAEGAESSNSYSH